MVAPYFRYLKEGHEQTTVGLLLGMACQNRGSADPVTNVIVRMHIPNTYDSHLGSTVGTELPAVAQCTALVALGLLYQVFLFVSLFRFRFYFLTCYFCVWCS